MWTQRRVLYSRIGDNQDQEPASSSPLSKTRRKCFQILGLLALSLISGAIGFLASKSLFVLPSSAPPGPHGTLHGPYELTKSLTSNGVGTDLWTFVYNRSFSYPPSPTTDSAWRGLFPDGGGFFNHPTLPSTTSTLSVLHQLHCLV